MRVSSRMVAEILALVREKVRPGITTMELNELAEKETLRRGAKTAFKGYSGYNYSLCCSVNSQVIHGLPTRDKLQEGDILSVDFGVVYDGFYGDAALTIPVGHISGAAQRLLTVTEESLYVAIEYARPGNRLSDISHAVQNYVEITRIFGSTGVRGARDRQKAP